MSIVIFKEYIAPENPEYLNNLNKTIKNTINHLEQSQNFLTIEMVFFLL